MGICVVKQFVCVCVSDLRFCVLIDFQHMIISMFVVEAVSVNSLLGHIFFLCLVVDRLKIGDICACLLCNNNMGHVSFSSCTISFVFVCQGVEKSFEEYPLAFLCNVYKVL